jgi:hypothetical protein
MSLSTDARKRARGFRTRHIVDAPAGSRAAQFLWRLGIAGTIGFAALNLLIHVVGYRSKEWVSTPATTACLVGALVCMGVAVLGSLVRSAGGGR